MLCWPVVYTELQGPSGLPSVFKIIQLQLQLKRKDCARIVIVIGVSSNLFAPSKADAPGRAPWQSRPSSTPVWVLRKTAARLYPPGPLIARALALQTASNQRASLRSYIRSHKLPDMDRFKAAAPRQSTAGQAVRVSLVFSCLSSFKHCIPPSPSWSLLGSHSSTSRATEETVP